MSARRSSQRESLPPTLSHHQAIALLKRQAERAQQIETLRFDDPSVEAWENSTINLLNQTFGQPNGEMHKNTKDFAYAQGGPLYVNMSDHQTQANHVTKTKQTEKPLTQNSSEQFWHALNAIPALMQDSRRKENLFDSVSGLATIRSEFVLSHKSVSGGVAAEIARSVATWPRL